MNRARFPHLLLFIAVVSLPLSAQHQHEHTGSPPARLGDVTFPTSCQPSVQPEFNRAVALLHSFWYEKAAETFQEVAGTDPKCAIAHWGVAMTWFRPLWHPPTKEHRAQGRAAIEKAQAIGGATARERGYINALAAFYRDSETVDHRTRVLAYEQAMADVAAQNAGDEEAQIFHALAILGAAAASPPDKTFARQKKAGAMLEPVFQRRPQHPGVAHYIIHSYDYPELAERALEAARRYAKIAPDSPHALHMPSHIFTRLGLWNESIRANRRSADLEPTPGGKSHPLDYLVYAYLQQGRDDMALRAIEEIGGNITGEYMAGALGSYNALAMPARFALEREDWKAASALTVTTTAPSAEAVTHFAKGLGAIRAGDIPQAKRSLAELERLAAALKAQNDPQWTPVVDAQRMAVSAWVAHAEGRHAEALQLARAAADREEQVEKHPVTPGPLIPSRELLGDILMVHNQPAAALEAYESTLKKEPNRLRTLLGAARAAKAAGRDAVARQHYAALVALIDPQSARPALREAKAAAGGA